MSDIKAVLANGDSFAVTDFSIPTHIVAVGAKEELVEIWNNLTPENLKTVSITVEGATVLSVTDVTLDGVQFVGSSGTITAHFYLSGDLSENNTAELEAENADMKVALGLLGVSEKTEVE